MKTAEEILKKFKKVFFEDAPNSTGTAIEYSDVIEAMKEYAIEAIKADRENVARHAKAVGPLSETTSRNRTYVDRNSIINAPNIELL